MQQCWQPLPSRQSLYEEERHYQQAHASDHKALITINGLLGLFDIN